MTTDYVLFPATVIVDSREQAPFQFTGFTADARHKGKPLIVPIEIAGLTTGDYSLAGFEQRICVERKSKADAYGTFGRDRERWERELDRMAKMDFAAVVVEASLLACLTDPPPNTKFLPKSFYRSVIAWQVRYRTIQWCFAPSRHWAERTTLRWLERFWLDEKERIKQGAKG